MSRKRRRHSSTDMYHVIVRGNAKMNLFIDDSDRIRFLDTMHRYFGKTAELLHTWCLMSNHVHMLVQMPMESLSDNMKRLEISYAAYFNRKYDRVGHVFQGRFKSMPVETDEYFVSVVKYIHNNPVAAGICASCSDYKWSSYQHYLRSSDSISRSLVIEMFGGIEEFADSHKCVDRKSDSEGGCTFLEAFPKPRYMNDVKAFEVMRNMLGGSPLSVLNMMDIGSIRRYVVELKRRGVSYRQISRLTGLTRRMMCA